MTTATATGCTPSPELHLGANEQNEGCSIMGVNSDVKVNGCCDSKRPKSQLRAEAVEFHPSTCSADSTTMNADDSNSSMSAGNKGQHQFNKDAQEFVPGRPYHAPETAAGGARAYGNAPFAGSPGYCYGYAAPPYAPSGIMPVPIHPYGAPMHQTPPSPAGNSGKPGEEYGYHSAYNRGNNRQHNSRSNASRNSGGTSQRQGAIQNNRQAPATQGGTKLPGTWGTQSDGNTRSAYAKSDEDKSNAMSGGAPPPPPHSMHDASSPSPKSTSKSDSSKDQTSQDKKRQGPGELKYIDSSSPLTNTSLQDTPGNASDTSSNLTKGKCGESTWSEHIKSSTLNIQSSQVVNSGQASVLSPGSKSQSPNEYHEKKKGGSVSSNSTSKKDDTSRQFPNQEQTHDRRAPTWADRMKEVASRPQTSKESKSPSPELSSPVVNSGHAGDALSDKPNEHRNMKTVSEVSQTSLECPEHQFDDTHVHSVVSDDTNKVSADMDFENMEGGAGGLSYADIARKEKRLLLAPARAAKQTSTTGASQGAASDTKAQSSRAGDSNASNPQKASKEKSTRGDARSGRSGGANKKFEAAKPNAKASWSSSGSNDKSKLGTPTTAAPSNKQGKMHKTGTDEENTDSTSTPNRPLASCWQGQGAQKLLLAGNKANSPQGPLKVESTASDADANAGDNGMADNESTAPLWPKSRPNIKPRSQESSVQEVKQSPLKPGEVQVYALPQGRKEITMAAEKKKKQVEEHVDERMEDIEKASPPPQTLPPPTLSRVGISVTETLEKVDNAQVSNASNNKVVVAAVLSSDLTSTADVSVEKSPRTTSAKPSMSDADHKSDNEEPVVPEPVIPQKESSHIPEDLKHEDIEPQCHAEPTKRDTPMKQTPEAKVHRDNKVNKPAKSGASTYSVAQMIGFKLALNYDRGIFNFDVEPLYGNNGKGGQNKAENATETKRPQKNQANNNANKASSAAPSKAEDSWRTNNMQPKAAAGGNNRSAMSLAGFFSQERPADFGELRAKGPICPTTLLPISETSWVKMQQEQKADTRQQLLRSLQGLLNKLTLEKFEKIYQQILASGLCETEDLSSFLGMIFDKAVTQHHFIQMYVMLCTRLQTDYKEAVEGDGKSTFKRMLVNQCEDSFLSHLEPLQIPDNLLEEEAFEYELQYKHKMKGNMIFVGELLKVKIISSTILFECIDRLLSKRLECIKKSNGADQGIPHVEALCVFLHTVGPSFDHPKWKYYNKFCERLETVSRLQQDETLPFRVRCLLKDVLDNRAEQWRKKFAGKKEGPKSLADLHLQAQLEEQQHTSGNRGQQYQRNNNFNSSQNMPNNAGAFAKRNANMGNNNTGNNSQKRASNLFADDGWEIAQTRRTAPKNNKNNVPNTNAPPASKHVDTTSASPFSAMGRVRMERDKERTFERRLVGNNNSWSSGSKNGSVKPEISSEQTAFGNQSTAASESARASDGSVSSVTRQDILELINSFDISEALTAVKSHNYSTKEDQHGYMSQVLHTAVELLAKASEQCEKQRVVVFEYMVRLCTEAVFEADVLKVCLKEFMEPAVPEEESIYEDLKCDAPYLQEFMKELLTVVEQHDSNHIAMSTSCLDDLKGRL